MAVVIGGMLGAGLRVAVASCDCGFHFIIPGEVDLMFTHEQTHLDLGHVAWKGAATTSWVLDTLPAILPSGPASALPPIPR